MRLSRLSAVLALLTFALGCQSSWKVNTVLQENEKQGDRSWIIPAAQHAEYQIEGYASAPSVNRGEAIRFFVSTDEPAYTLKVFRLGWYSGDGARLLKTVALSGGTQPSCPTDAGTNLVDCNWSNPYVLEIPDNPLDSTDWASGIYLAQLTQNKSGKQNYIPFVVRDDARPADIKFVAGSATWVAYNAGVDTTCMWGEHPKATRTGRARCPSTGLSTADSARESCWAWAMRFHPSGFSNARDTTSPMFGYRCAREERRVTQHQHCISGRT